MIKKWQKCLVEMVEWFTKGTEVKNMLHVASKKSDICANCINIISNVLFLIEGGIINQYYFIFTRLMIKAKSQTNEK